MPNIIAQNTVTSHDGTIIAYSQIGQGPVVILVDGDDQVMAVRCPDEAAANELGGAAMLSDGRASAPST